MLFGFNKKKTDCPITEPDRHWVEDNFQWLIEVYGYPTKKNEQFLINEKHFPQSFRESEIKVDNLIADLCELLVLDKSRINSVLEGDLSDTHGIPYEQSNPFGIETEISPEGYRLHFRKSLTKNPKRLISSLIYEMIIIRLTESELSFETEEDTPLFIYIAGVYLGFGVVLAQQLVDIGRASDGMWETKWNYVSEMPVEVMAFALALSDKLTDQDNPVWAQTLTGRLKDLYTQATVYLTEVPSPIVNKTELLVGEFFIQADAEYKNNDFDAAISTLQKILFLTKHNASLADVHNNTGYYLLRKEEFEKSIQSFKNALELAPDYGFALDNLGYALIKLGKLEEGKKYIDRAEQTFNNDVAYTYRNFALYYQAKGNFEKAEEYFTLAFDSISIPVDLLEFQYAEFLSSQGQAEKAAHYLKIALDKGEPEVIKRVNTLKKV